MARKPVFLCSTHMPEFLATAENVESNEDVHATKRKPCIVDGCEDDKTRRVRFAEPVEVQHDDGDVAGSM